MKQAVPGGDYPPVALEGRVGFEPTTPGLKVRFLFGPHSAWLAESAGRFRARSARTNPPVLPA